MIDVDSGVIAPEQRLFLGVIVNAAQEAAGSVAGRDRVGKAEQASADARAWFNDAGEDYQTVCTLAGLERTSTRARVLAYLDRVTDDPANRAKVKRVNGTSRRTSVSMPDVARQAGVSPTTVANVIKGRDHITPATRARVQAAMIELGYSCHVH